MYTVEVRAAVNRKNGKVNKACGVYVGENLLTLTNTMTEALAAAQLAYWAIIYATGETVVFKNKEWGKE